MALSSSHRSAARLIGVVAIVAIATLAASRFYARAVAAPKGSAERLARIVGAHRVTRARMTGGFAYAKCEADSLSDRLVRDLACRSPGQSTWSSAEKLGSFAQELLETPDSSRSHVAGVWGLLWGRTDEALNDLREAARRAPKDARALNDLGVAYTAYAAEHDDPSALVDAFIAVDSAVRADSTIDEARFNHALLLEHLQLRVDAVTAWNRYLAGKPASQWAREAREHLASLGVRDSAPTRADWDRARTDSQSLNRLIGRDLPGAREFAIRELGAWAIAVQAGDTTAARHLLQARLAANGFRERTSDALLSDGVAVIDRAIAENNAARLHLLVEGHAALKLGLDSFSVAKLSRPALATAKSQLARAASPMASWALLFEARSRINGAPRVVLEWLTAIRDSAPSSYISLRMSAVQYIGYIHDLGVDCVHAIVSYDSAITENQTIHDSDVTLRAASWLAQCQEILRGHEPAWRTRYQVLVASREFPPSSRAFFTAFDYAAVATMTDAPRLALRYEEAATRNAQPINSPTASLIAYAFRRRADLLVRLGQDSLARAAIDSARAAARLAQSSGLDVDIDLASAYVDMRSAPTKAEAQLRQVVDEYAHGASKDEQALSRAWLYLAQARAAAGMIDSARAAFDSATTLMQRQRASLSNVADRGAFLDAARAVIDQILAFHIEHDSTKAFEFFESTRSRVLLDQLASNGSASRPREVLSELRRRLPKGDVMVSYAVLPRALVVWTVGHDQFSQRIVPISAPALENLVTKFRESVRTAEGEPDSLLGGRLYRMLIDSTTTGQSGGNLIIVPDRWLHFLPFVALRNPSTGRLLLREYRVSYEPSAALLLNSLSQMPQRSSPVSSVLAIGNPSFEQGALHLQNLPSAAIEANRVASIYGNPTVLVDKEATDAAFAALAPQADVIHFAGHAVVGRDAPQRSHLVLASDGQSAGVLFSTDIAEWRLRHTRLVVLSACSTSDGRLSPTEGASSLARAFFAAGVPAVVSSLWQVDDADATADFFRAFHKAFERGESAAQALQDAQIRALTEGGRSRPARSWAAFQVFGRS